MAVDKPTTLPEILEHLKECVQKDLYFEINPQDSRVLLEAIAFAVTHSTDLTAAQAHRACVSAEHSPENGKRIGTCIVCGIPWPCETAQYFLRKPITTPAV